MHASRPSLEGLENKIQVPYYLVSSPIGAPAAIAAVVDGNGKSDVIDGYARRTVIVVDGRSFASTGTMPNLRTAPIPDATRPKIECLPSSHGAGANVI